MSYLYLDSSILVSLAVEDARNTVSIRKTIEKHKTIGTSEITVVEAQAGLISQLGKNQNLLSNAEQNLNRILGSMNLFSVNSIVLGSARSLVKQYRASVGLRSMDAIHLATAKIISQSSGDQRPVELNYLTSDKKQHAAFTAEGYVGELI